VRHAAFGPLFALVAADAVEQIEHGIFLVLRIAGRRVNLHPALCAHRLRVVINALQFAVLDSFACFVESLGRIWKSRFVVRLQFNRSTESAAATARALLPRRGISFGCAAFAFGCGFRRTEVADFARELDLVGRDFPRVGDLNIVVLNLQRLNERHRFALDLAVLQLGFAFLAVAFHVGFASDARAVLLERERVFLQTTLGVELGFPCSGDVRSKRGE
jgi:hypothetical protein